MVDAEATPKGRPADSPKSEYDTHNADGTHCCAKILVVFLHRHLIIPLDLFVRRMKGECRTVRFRPFHVLAVIKD